MEVWALLGGAAAGSEAAAQNAARNPHRSPFGTRLRAGPSRGGQGM